MTSSSISLKIFANSQNHDLEWTNHGKETVRIWQLNNSWGWYSISVEAIADESYFLRLEDREWTRNGPGFIVITPGQTYTAPFPETTVWQWEKAPSPDHEWKGWKVVWEAKESPERDSLGISTDRLTTELMEVNDLFRGILPKP